MRLRQILVNLIGNAIKFSPDGNVRILTRSVAAGEGLQRVHVGIEDDGVGISEENLEKIFRSWRSPQTLSRMAVIVAFGPGCGMSPRSPWTNCACAKCSNAGSDCPESGRTRSTGEELPGANGAGCARE